MSLESSWELQTGGWTCLRIDETILDQLLRGSSAAFVVQALFVVQFGWIEAPRYAAFLQNLLMSGLFIALYVSRRGRHGQSLVVAVAKWLGTLAPTILFGVFEGSAFITGLGVLCSIFDLTYIGLIARDPLGRMAASGGEQSAARGVDEGARALL